MEKIIIRLQETLDYTSSKHNSLAVEIIVNFSLQSLPGKLGEWTEPLSTRPV